MVVDMVVGIAAAVIVASAAAVIVVVKATAMFHTGRMRPASDAIQAR